MKVTILKSFAFIVAAASLTGCVGKKDVDKSDRINGLVAELVSIANTYYDSISRPGDSNYYDRMMSRFDSAMTKANYRYEPDLYLQMHETENDTIAKAILRVTAKLDSMKNPKNPKTIIINGDTIPVDSLPPVPYRR